MKNSIREITIGGRELLIYLPKNYEVENRFYPVVYINGDDSTKSILENAEYLSKLEYIIVSIESENRLSELTPWPSKSLHPKFPDFGGTGDELIECIENELKPQIDMRYRTLKEPESTGLAGYSLGGLFAIYSAYRTEIFGSIASMSGSFWYPDFTTFASKEPMMNPNIQFYLSSGDREGEGHKDIKKDAVLFTKEIHGLLENITSNKIILNWHEGGHHNKKEEKYQGALLWFQEHLQY